MRRRKLRGSCLSRVYRTMRFSLWRDSVDCACKSAITVVAAPKMRESTSTPPAATMSEKTS